jgi:nucleotide-binding universal stress UspA family protein
MTTTDGTGAAAPTAAKAATAAAPGAADPAGGRRRRIVVGVDGSQGSVRAVEWAAAEAGRGGAELEIHTAYSPGYVFVTAEDVRQAMHQVVHEATEVAAAIAPGVPVRGVAHEATPARSLIEASRGADLLVVGSRGRGGFAGLLLGSVSQQCSLHAHCTTVIVRTPPAQPGRAS